MNRLVTLALSTSLAAPVVAQEVSNSLDDPNASMIPAAGTQTYFQHFDPGEIPGIGNVNGSAVAVIDRIRLRFEDAERTTRDPIQVGFYSATSSGPGVLMPPWVATSPDPGPAGPGFVEALVGGTWSVPVGPDGFYVAVRVTRNPGWPNDGLGLAKTVDGAAPGGDKGHRARAGMAQDLWCQDGLAGAITPCAVNGSFGIWLRSPAPSLNVANIADLDGNGTTESGFGFGGNHPDSAATGTASQGLAVRTTSRGGAADSAIVLAAPGPATAAQAFPQITGKVYLNFTAGPPITVVATNGTGITHPVISPGMDIMPPGVVLTLQTVVLTSSGALQMGNASVVDL